MSRLSSLAFKQRAEIAKEIHSDPVLFTIVEGLILAAGGHDPRWDPGPLNYLRQRGGDEAVERYEALIRDEDRMLEIARIMGIVKFRPAAQS